MSSKPRYLLSLAILLASLPLFGQRNYYFDKNDTYYDNNIINDPRHNSQYCQISKDDQVLKLTPYQIEGYGFARKQLAYYSVEINRGDSVKKAFLLLLTDGKTPLYYYRNGRDRAFYIEKDDSRIIELPRNTKDTPALKSFLASLSLDCKSITADPRLVSYNRKSLTEYFSKYNECRKGDLHLFRYGISAGYNIGDYKISENLILFYLDYLANSIGRGYTVEVFVDQPIGYSNLSFHPAIDLSHILYEYDSGSPTTWKGRITTLTVPLTFRYYFNTPIIKPFISAGALFGSNVSRKFSLNGLTGTETEDTMSEADFDSDWAKVNMGWIASAGAEIKIDFRRRLDLEVRYSDMMRMVYKGSSISNPVISILAGISF